MGGELLEAKVHRNGEHVEYQNWNRLSSGQEVDFTRTQFEGDDRVIGQPFACERPPVLKPRFQAMYETLLSRVLSQDNQSLPLAWRLTPARHARHIEAAMRGEADRPRSWTGG